jgi:hypothetical protein
MPSYAIQYSAPLSPSASVIAVGDVLVSDGAGLYLLSTTANRGTRRSTGLARTASSNGEAIDIQESGEVDPSVSGLATGTASWVRVSSTGRLERCTPSGSDDVVGWAETDGTVHLFFGMLTATIANAISSVTTPTGTGFRHVTGGTEDGAAALVTDADISASAAIACSKLGGGAQTYAGSSYTSTADAKGTAAHREPVSVKTTDATPTTIDSFTLASNTAVAITALVTAIKSDGSQAGSWSVTACFRNNAGVVAQVGTTTSISIGVDDAAWTATADNATTTIRVRVTGKAATTIRWTVVYTRLEVIP